MSVNKKKPCIDRMLALSTCHITKFDSDLLSGKTGTDTTAAVSSCFGVTEYEFGWILFLFDIKEDGFNPKNMTNAGFSRAFCKIVEFAVTTGCSFIRLDADADDYEDFPKFDW